MPDLDTSRVPRSIPDLDTSRVPRPIPDLDAPRNQGPRSSEQLEAVKLAKSLHPTTANNVVSRPVTPSSSLTSPPQSQQDSSSFLPCAAPPQPCMTSQSPPPVEDKLTPNQQEAIDIFFTD